MLPAEQESHLERTRRNRNVLAETFGARPSREVVERLSVSPSGQARRHSGTPPEVPGQPDGSGRKTRSVVRRSRLRLDPSDIYEFESINRDTSLHQGPHAVEDPAGHREPSLPMPQTDCSAYCPSQAQHGLLHQADRLDRESRFGPGGVEVDFRPVIERQFCGNESYGAPVLGAIGEGYCCRREVEAATEL
jgi:hypothetical protein